MMSKLSRPLRAVPLIASGLAIAAMLFLLVGCSSDTGSLTSTGSPQAASGAAALVPADVRADGVLSTGSTLNFPPFESLDADGKTPIGLDVEIMQGIASKLGLDSSWINMNWDGLRPALQSGRFETVIASMADFTDRQREVTFVDYMTGGGTPLLLKGNAAKVHSVDDLAGKTIGGAAGTYFVSHFPTLNKELTDKGLAPMVLRVFPDDAPGVIAVQSGRIYAHFLDTACAVYKAKTAGDGTVFGTALPDTTSGYPYGIAVSKDNPELAN